LNFVNLHSEWLRLLTPELIVVITALVALLADTVCLRQQCDCIRIKAGSIIVSLGCLIAVAWLSLYPANVHLQMLSITPTVAFIKQVVLGLAIFTALVTTRFTKHIGEYFALLLLAVVGLMLLVSSKNLLLIFVSLELLSVSLYAMAAFEKTSLASSEASLKYFLFGAMAAAFTLFGMSLIYGITGTLDLGDMTAKFKDQSIEPVFYVALVMTLVGFAFKLAAAPFHLWAPDAYQGAPTPVAAFIASGSKVGSFFVIARILFEGFGGRTGSAAWGNFLPGWMPFIAVLAVLSMIVGNVAALLQTNVRRLLAYSAVAHAGYALLALFGKNQAATTSALLYYVITYAITVLGAFTVISVVEQGNKHHSDLSNFAGLSHRAPVLSICMGIFMLSLAGIPPLSGFFGKFYVFTTTIGGSENLRLLWLVVVAICASAVSFYYYLQVLKQIFVNQAPEQSAPIEASPVTQAAIVVLAILVVLLGCLPNLLLGQLESATVTPVF